MDISIELFVISQTYNGPNITSNCVYSDETIQLWHKIKIFLTYKAFIDDFLLDFTKVHFDKKEALNTKTTKLIVMFEILRHKMESYVFNS